MDPSRVEVLVAGLQRQIDGIKGMVDPERSVLTAQYMKVDDPSSPQIIRVSEGGTLEMGGEGSWKIIGAVTEEVSHTGDTNPTTLAEIVVPADSMGKNGIIRVSTICKPYTSAYFAIYFGQIIPANRIIRNIHYSAALLVDSRPAYVWNKNAVNLQGAGGDHTQSMSVHQVVGGTPKAMTEDTTQDKSIYFTVQNFDAAHTSYLYLALVEACYRD